MSQSLDTNRNDTELVSPVQFGEALKKISSLTTEQEINLASRYNLINPTEGKACLTKEQVIEISNQIEKIIDPIINIVSNARNTDTHETTQELMSALLTIKKPFQQALNEALNPKH